MSCIPCPSSPASVAELGGVRPRQLSRSAAWRASRFPSFRGHGCLARSSPALFVLSHSQHAPVPARAVPLSHPSFRPVHRFVHALSAAAPIIPPPESTSVFPAVQRSLCRRGPNHALQRTATGGQPFSVFFALRRRCLSLSLSSLGGYALCSVSSSALPGRPSVVPGRPSVADGRLSVVPGRPSSVPGRPSVVPGRPSATDGRPSVVPGRPSIIPGRSFPAP